MLTRNEEDLPRRIRRAIARGNWISLDITGLKVGDAMALRLTYVRGLSAAVEQVDRLVAALSSWRVLDILVVRNYELVLVVEPCLGPSENAVFDKTAFARNIQELEVAAAWRASVLRGEKTSDLPSGPSSLRRDELGKLALSLAELEKNHDDVDAILPHPTGEARRLRLPRAEALRPPTEYKPDKATTGTIIAIIPELGEVILNTGTRLLLDNKQVLATLRVGTKIGCQTEARAVTRNYYHVCSSIHLREDQFI